MVVRKKCVIKDLFLSVRQNLLLHFCESRIATHVGYLSCDYSNLGSKINLPFGPENPLPIANTVLPLTNVSNTRPLNSIPSYAVNLF